MADILDIVVQERPQKFTVTKIAGLTVGKMPKVMARIILFFIRNKK